MLGGAAGTLASFGDQGFALQDKFAASLALSPAAVPSRTHRDREAEYVSTIAMLAATGGKIGHEMYTLMKQEFAEAGEPVPAGTVGSSTMPQKRNPIMAQDIVAGSAQIRALVPLALDAMMTEHEANRATTVMMRAALGPACIQMGDMLSRLILIAEDMWLDPERMRKNLDLTGGMILSEAIMMELGQQLGRQDAHDVVYEAVDRVLAGQGSFSKVLAADPAITSRLDASAVDNLLDPAQYTGQCAYMARQQAGVAPGTGCNAHGANREQELTGTSSMQCQSDRLGLASHVQYPYELNRSA